MKKGSKQSEEAKQKMSEARKKNWTDPTYRKNACDARKHPAKFSQEEIERRRNRMVGNTLRVGLPCPEKAKEINGKRISQINISRRGEKPWNSGKTGIYSKETLEKMSIAKRGENHPCFKNWSSYEPYCELFNEDLKTRCREFFNNTCFMCGSHRSEFKRNLSVHHIWADKKACCEDKMSVEEMNRFRLRLPQEIARFGSNAFTETELQYLRMIVPLCPYCHNDTIFHDSLEQRMILTGKLLNEYNGKCYFTKKEYTSYKKR